MSELFAVLTDLEPIDPADGDVPPRLPALERLLSRATRVDAPRDWRRFVLERVGLDAPGPELPVGATIAAAAGLDAASGTWLVATPVPLLATLSDVRMDSAGPRPLEPDVGHAFASQVTAALSDAGFALHYANGALLAHFDDALDVETTDPAPLAGRRIDVQLPRGRDGGRVRRRMTELQMLLHDASHSRALPGANALWLWGGGRAQVGGRATWPRVDGDDAFLRALHALDAARIDRSDARVVTWRLAALGGEGDAFSAADRTWFASLADDLARGHVRRATLHVAGRAYELRPSQRWRFWSKIQPWWELAA
jgi:hypothetical protein